MKCFCCGADITAPQFHNGRAYGWTCIKKAVPGKRRRNLTCAQADRVEITPERRRAWIDGEVIWQGLKYPSLGPDHDLNVNAWLIAENGVVQLEIMADRGGKSVPVPAWRIIDPAKYKKQKTA